MPSSEENIEFDSGYRLGIQEGRIEMRKEILSYLQTKYMNINISVSDPSMVATLKIAEEIAKEFPVGNKG